MPGGNILHCNAVRIRVVGSGNLDLQFFGYNDIKSQQLVPLVLTPTNAYQLTRLANFKSQALRLKISVDAIDEYFTINKITAFTKPIYSSYPGN